MTHAAQRRYQATAPRRAILIGIVPLCLIMARGTLASAQSVTVAAAGDIACDPNHGTASGNACQMQATSDLILAAGADAVLALGDLQYPGGELNGFRRSFDASWGRLDDILYPVPGNHEYLTRRAEGYYNYFRYHAVGAPGYYSFDLGAWHVVALNSNCNAVGGCDAASPQVAWLQHDLAANQSTCTLAFWHQPRFSSGHHGSDTTYSAFWNVLAAAGTEIVLSGHDHHYERFAPQTSSGQPDPAGIRQFVVGTGGKGLRAVEQTERNSEAIVAGEFGVLFLTLNESDYAWSFVSITGETSDYGAGLCR